MPVGSPVLDITLNGFLRANHDDGIQKSPESTDGPFELSNMGVRQIALIRAWAQPDGSGGRPKPPSVPRMVL